jgi:hypothetical protein
MTDFWPLQPLKTFSKPGETFNLSSPNATVNILSVMFFTSLMMMKKFMPQQNIASLFTYAMVFFIILTSLLSDNFMKPPENPRGGIAGVSGANSTDGNSNPYDFSRTRQESDVLTIS